MGMQKTYNGPTVAGRDYSVPLVDVLPGLIGGDEEPMSKREIAEVVGRDSATITNVFAKNRENLYIAGWRRSKFGNPTALWKWGKGKDAERIAKLSSKERSANWRKGRGENVSKARYARKKAERHGLKGIDPLLAAIMGVR